ncbi:MULTISPECIES: hypothetical protein [Clostridium]|uniref:Uncharacterized protein n=1 Tax=Clostridium aquiflavi TaxID=3073603 RepID=A0ABU1EJ57_9CLOT|nr:MULTISPECIES: hypothetical protein [unclassified Clostridium]MDR5588426.1 hypothetical protein [Clostridium sp. 5N-1]
MFRQYIEREKYCQLIDESYEINNQQAVAFDYISIRITEEN